MTENHPITPPFELLADWLQQACKYSPNDHSPATLGGLMAYKAARWGADAELEACCEWLEDPDLNVDTYKLRAARRPQPPSLKQQALEELESMCGDFNAHGLGFDAPAIRRALEQLDD